MSELPPPQTPEAIGWFVLTAAALVVIARNVVGLWRDTRPQPPLQLQYAPRETVEVLAERVAAIEQHAITREMFEREVAERDRWRAEVTEKLDELLQRTAHLVGYGAKN